jgi:predicted N-acetyltransferase YhbS
MPLAEYAIRPAIKREITEIEPMNVAAYLQYRGVALGNFDAYVGDLRQLATDWDEAQVMVAKVDGWIAGSVMFYAEAGPEAFGLLQEWAGFRKLAVHPAMRGRGLGRKLTEKCVEIAGTLGSPTIGIHTASFMKAAPGSTNGSGSGAVRSTMSRDVPQRSSSVSEGWLSGRRPSGHSNFRSRSAMGKSLMLAMRSRMRPCSSNSQFSLP